MLEKINSWFAGGSHETSPLLIGMVGISIPVTLIAVACIGGGTPVLILAVIAMILVGAGTLTFVVLLASDPPESDEDPAEHTSTGAA
jgi:hypothetical protein